MGIQDSTVLEASSIGRLTRTLSAAALGNNGQGEPGMDRNASWGQDLMAANYMGSGGVGPGPYAGRPTIYGEEYSPYHGPFPLEAQDLGPTMPGQYTHRPVDVSLHQLNGPPLGGEAGIAEFPPVPGFDPASPNLAPPSPGPGPGPSFSMTSDRPVHTRPCFPPDRPGDVVSRGLPYPESSPHRGPCASPGDIYGSLPRSLMPDTEVPQEGGADYKEATGMGSWRPMGNSAPTSSGAKSLQQSNIVTEQTGPEASIGNDTPAHARLW